MSGHSKWHSIKHKKAATDAARGKILTKHAKILTIAARGNANPETNATLRAAISNAKSDGVPKNNIEKILKKAAGEKNGDNFSEQIYEGFGPAGIAFIVTALTDNPNRTFPSVRTAFSKNGGTLGSSGSVAFLFDRVGVILIENDEKKEDEIFEIAIDAGAENFIFDENGQSEILTKFENLAAVREKIAEKISVKKSEIQFRAKDPKIISDEKILAQIEKFVAAIEEIDDVDEIFGAFDVE